MSGSDEDDKPTMLLDLNALKKQKIKEEEDLATVVSELEFIIPKEEAKPSPKKPRPLKEPVSDKPLVILFDHESTFFEKSKDHFPQGFEYKLVKTLDELNQCLKLRSFQIVVFNYDVNSKAVNKLCAQIKTKRPTTKTIIMASSISSERASAHAQTPSGANGYYQYPLVAEKILRVFEKLKNIVSKAS